MQESTNASTISFSWPVCWLLLPFRLQNKHCYFPTANIEGIYPSLLPPRSSSLDPIILSLLYSKVPPLQPQPHENNIHPLTSHLHHTISTNSASAHRPNPRWSLTTKPQRWQRSRLATSAPIPLKRNLKRRPVANDPESARPSLAGSAVQERSAATAMCPVGHAWSVVPALGAHTTRSRRLRPPRQANRHRPGRTMLRKTTHRNNIRTARRHLTRPLPGLRRQRCPGRSLLPQSQLHPRHHQPCPQGRNTSPRASQQGRHLFPTGLSRATSSKDPTARHGSSVWAIGWHHATR